MALSESDRLFLRQSIELAEGGRFTCAPNPCVGCVIVRDGLVIGRGFHIRAGEGHAEVNALADARANGHDVSGATVYVSLEPCAHVGRTPACASTLVESGVGRVVVAMQDPFPQVAGAGIDILRQHDVVVDVSNEPEAHKLIRGYLKRIDQGLPWVRIKTATSMDGAVALANGDSQWITGPEARQDVQYWRARSDAIITGVGTVLADNPSLTVREPDLAPCKPPLRVVLDRRLRTPADANLLNDGYDTLLCHDAEATVPDYITDNPAVTTYQLASVQPLRTLLQHLAEQDCNEVMVEAGPAVCGSFVEADLWDEWVSYLAPKWLGSDSQSVAQFSVSSLAAAPAAKLVDTDHFGEDVRLIFERATSD